MDAEITEPPQKRVKITCEASQGDGLGGGVAASTPGLTENHQALKEVEVGITHFVSPNSQGFSGVLKKRYTDFLVNEILPSGDVLHLASLEAPFPQNENDEEAEGSGSTQKQKVTLDVKGISETSEFQLLDEDRVLLEKFLSPEITRQILVLHGQALALPAARPSDLGRIKSSVITDRDLRTRIHHAIRRIFDSRLESSTDSDGSMVISPAPNRNRKGPQVSRDRGRNQRKGWPNWDELGGPYLHFTIHKENKDTMEVISYLARQLKINAKIFQFAGTKDKRGVTVQRACAYRLHADRLARLNKSLWNAKLGDFEYRNHGLELGDLGGNEFVITLRNCEFPGLEAEAPESIIPLATELIGKSLRDLWSRGYLNYYGLQRFGSFSTRTDVLGLKMLQEDFKGAAEAILHFSPRVLAAAQEIVDPNYPEVLISTDDKARAEAIHIFLSTGKVNDALDKLPRKFLAEGALIRHLGRAKHDYLGALQTIPRNLRLMYVHAYQSLVWNHAASERWRLYGDKVVEGDLVLVNEHKEEHDNAERDGDIDADGEPILNPQAEDSANSMDDMFLRSRALTAEEAASEKYDIFNVVLPLPGFDVLYPANQMTAFYERFMTGEAGGGINPFDMRRRWKDISLSGSYRKLLSRPGPQYSFEVKKYSRDDEQFVQTDLERLSCVTTNIKSESTPESGDKVAVVLKFQLGSSQYATMALRELMKTGGAKTYIADFAGGR